MQGARGRYTRVLKSRRKIFIYLFEQYLFRGAQFSEAGLNGALMKRTKNTKNNKR